MATKGLDLIDFVFPILRFNHYQHVVFFASFVSMEISPPYMYALILLVLESNHSPSSDMASKHDNDDASSNDVKAKRMFYEVLQSKTSMMLLYAKKTIIASKKLNNNTKIYLGVPKKVISYIRHKSIKLRHQMKRT
ncbi:unnamed protein product [Lactuca saligna]|uniref:Uncharacterized protein n=1 Tax=Lactuca saligna TaxID=75948 RepID=A0AA35YY77_LACSI|nr:unnamed protein product [Lactuca saligna]